MQIELTRLHIVPHPTVKAVASILIDGELAVHDIKILQFGSELTVTMPNKADGKGVYRDMVHPINHELRQQINDLLLGEYRKRGMTNE